MIGSYAIYCLNKSGLPTTDQKNEVLSCELVKITGVLSVDPNIYEVEFCNENLKGCHIDKQYLHFDNICFFINNKREYSKGFVMQTFHFVETEDMQVSNGGPGHFETMGETYILTNVQPRTYYNYGKVVRGFKAQIVSPTWHKDKWIILPPSFKKTLDYIATKPKNGPRV